jgi:ribosome-binding protein aMBF1 (putative translation factor)
LNATVASAARFKIGSAATAMKDKERGSPASEELRELLKDRRHRARISQEQLAVRLGWDQKVISNLERGAKRMTVLELVEIANALGFDAASVVRRLQKRPPPK